MMDMVNTNENKVEVLRNIITSMANDAVSLLEGLSGNKDRKLLANSILANAHLYASHTGLVWEDSMVMSAEENLFIDCPWNMGVGLLREIVGLMHVTDYENTEDGTQTSYYVYDIAAYLNHIK